MKLIRWIIALCGLWEFGDIAALVVPGFGAMPLFLWNHIIVGAVLMLAGAGAALTKHTGAARSLLWAAAAAGAWLIAAAVLLGDPANIPGRWNDIIVGALALILSVWAAAVMRRSV